MIKANIQLKILFRMYKMNYNKKIKLFINKFNQIRISTIKSLKIN